MENTVFFKENVTFRPAMSHNPIYAFIIAITMQLLLTTPLTNLQAT